MISTTPQREEPGEGPTTHSGPNVTRVDCEAWDTVINGPLHTFWDELHQVDQDRRTR